MGTLHTLFKGEPCISPASTARSQRVVPQEGILVAIRTPVPCPRSYVVSRSLLRSSAICFRQSHATPCHRRRKAQREIIESSRHFSLRLCDNELTSPSLLSAFLNNYLSFHFHLPHSLAHTLRSAGERRFCSCKIENTDLIKLGRHKGVSESTEEGRRKFATVNVNDVVPFVLISRPSVQV